jgi:hypothetical protein
MQITVKNPKILYTDDDANWSLEVEHRKLTPAEKTLWGINEDSFTMNHILSHNCDTEGGIRTQDRRFFAAERGDWELNVWVEDGAIVGFELRVICCWEFGNGCNILSLTNLLGVVRMTMAAQGFEWPAFLEPFYSIKALAESAKSDIENRGIHWSQCGEG